MDGAEAMRRIALEALREAAGLLVQAMRDVGLHQPPTAIRGALDAAEAQLKKARGAYEAALSLGGR